MHHLFPHLESNLRRAAAGTRHVGALSAVSSLVGVPKCQTQNWLTNFCFLWTSLNCYFCLASLGSEFPSVSFTHSVVALAARCSWWQLSWLLAPPLAAAVLSGWLGGGQCECKDEGKTQTVLRSCIWASSLWSFAVSFVVINEADKQATRPAIDWGQWCGL